MTYEEVRFDVQLISAQALAQYMLHRGFTVRSLAAHVARKTPCSRATIGHLRSGSRKTCSPEVAREIERCLDAPRGSLFVPKVSRVARNTGRAA